MPQRSAYKEAMEQVLLGDQATNGLETPTEEAPPAEEQVQAEEAPPEEELPPEELAEPEEEGPEDTPEEGVPQEEEEPSEEEAEEEQEPGTEEAQDGHRVQIKVDGETKDLTVGELKVLAQKAAFAEKTIEENRRATQEHQTKEKHWERFQKDFKESPFEALTKLFERELKGDRARAEQYVREMTEKYVWDWLQYDKLEPEQQELERENRERIRRNKELKEEEETRQQRLRENQIVEAKKAIDREISRAIKEVALPPDPEIVKRVAKKMLDAGREGIQMTSVQAAQLVKKELPELMGKLAEFLDEEEISRRFPKLTERLRKADIRAVKQKIRKGSTLTGRAARTGSTQPSRRQEPKRHQSAVEWRNELAKYLRG